MSDLMKRETRGKLALGTGGIVAGVALLGLTGWIVSLGAFALVPGALVLWGSWRLFQKPSSSLVGMVGLAAGVLIAATALPLVGGLASLLLTLSGVGLLAGGVWSVVQVFRSRRKP